MLPEELTKLPMSLEKLFYDVQDRIITDVVRRIKKAGEITSTADYQLNRYQILGGTTEMIESEIKSLTNKTDAEMWELYDQVIEKDYTRNKELYEQINGSFLQYDDPENETMQSWVNGIVKQTQGEVQRISRSMGFLVTINGQQQYTALAKMYNKYVDAACLDVVTGAFDYNTVIKRTVKDLSRSGIKSIDYESGRWNRAPVAVRRAVLTGVNQVSAKINEKVAKDLGAKYFEVTAHSGARPSHAVWQGGVYTERELEQACGLGDVSGLCGANCRHAYYAFFPGISVRAYSDADLEKIRKDDAKLTEWQGKQYDGYGRTQKARAYETTMRAQRTEIKALKTAGADKIDQQAAQSRYLGTMDEYKSFCKKMGLKAQMERVYVDGLGRLVSGRRFVNTFYFSPEFEFKTYDDPARDVFGKAADSHPKLLKSIKKQLKSMGVVIIEEGSNMAYGTSTAGKPGNVRIDPNASISAWIHEFTHAKDDQKSGWSGSRILFDEKIHAEWERRAYDAEIDFALKYGYNKLANQLRWLKSEAIRSVYGKKLRK
jgi:hypothetical protein